MICTPLSRDRNAERVGPASVGEVYRAEGPNLNGQVAIEIWLAMEQVESQARAETLYEGPLPAEDALKV